MTYIILDNGIERPATEDEIAELNFIKSMPISVPQIITMKQARLALLAAGKLDAANTAFASASTQAQVMWDYSSTVERNNPLVISMGTTLGLSSSDIDNLFIQAATL
jgi:hypothetical protein